MRIPGIEILLNFVRNPQKISPFGKKKKSFLSKTYQAYLASWQPKNLTKWLKTVFWRKFGIKGFNWQLKRTRFLLIFRQTTLRPYEKNMKNN